MAGQAITTSSTLWHRDLPRVLRETIERCGSSSTHFDHPNNAPNVGDVAIIGGNAHRIVMYWPAKVRGRYVYIAESMEKSA